ncbi:hypothetical protein IFM89_034770 [Coptis chinensis]|uniref:Serine hydroxymethyltransferase-like domain-containing protein n=1 Tax=Coptis chinensis TaxID=261450 RepID=A0A835LJI5_9MAGN|nr:hypothetical protein IFM89_034770 [Coptis chinensis]
MPYRLDESTGLIDYGMLEKTAILFRPKLVIVGASAYPREFDYPHAVGAFLMMDKAHISGLVAASVVANHFEYCDVGGPHNHTIGGLAVCLKHAQSPEFRAYQNQVVSNCKALASRLMELGGMDGARAEKILDMASITLNKNSVPGDKSAQVPVIRIGTPAMTTRGFMENEFIATGRLHSRGKTNWS